MTDIDDVFTIRAGSTTGKSIPRQEYIAHTASGQPIIFLEPERTPIVWDDMIAHLGRACRYGGACWWTVLQHLALCTLMARDEGMNDRMVAIIAAHDLTEAYMPDLPKALKALVPMYGELENRWAAHIHDSLGLSLPTPDEEDALKCIDRRAVLLETWACHPQHMDEAQRHDPEPITDRERWLVRFVQGLTVTGELGRLVREAVEAGARS